MYPGINHQISNVPQSENEPPRILETKRSASRNCSAPWNCFEHWKLTVPPHNNGMFRIMAIKCPTSSEVTVPCYGHWKMHHGHETHRIINIRCSHHGTAPHRGIVSIQQIVPHHVRITKSRFKKMFRITRVDRSASWKDSMLRRIEPTLGSPGLLRHFHRARPVFLTGAFCTNNKSPNKKKRNGGKKGGENLVLKKLAHRTGDLYDLYDLYDLFQLDLSGKIYS